MASYSKPALKRSAAAPQRALPKEDKIIATAPTLPKQEGFIPYIIYRKENRRYLLAALLVNLILLLLYKYCYPYPDLNADAQGYIFAAASNQKVYYRPFGYSRFLQLLHAVTSSAYLLVAVQYFLAVLSALFCFFTTDYLFRFKSKKIKTGAWLLTSINPIFLVLANALLSDTLFAALSITWFTLLLWVGKRKSWPVLLFQLIILYWCFQVRYNALYYPFVAAAVFLFTPGMKLPYRFAGALGSLLLIMSTYMGIKNTTFKQTGADVFAGFSGWQAANNALFIYKHIDVRTEDFEDRDLQLLDKFVKRYIDSISVEQQQYIARHKVEGSPFLWDKNSPLKRYTFYYISSHKVNYFKAWYRVSPLYSRYATQIISDHPGAYIRHFLLPNLWYVFVPIPEFMERYNPAEMGMSQISQYWLRIKDPKYRAKIPGLKAALIRPYTIFHAVLMLFGLIVPVLYFIQGVRRERWKEKRFILLVLFWYLVLVSDMLFSLMAGAITLRYGAALFVIGFSLPLIFLDRLLAAKALTGTTTLEK